MKFKLLITTLLALGVSFQLHATSTSGDEKVNCTETVVSIPYYYGEASCYANGRWLSSYEYFSYTQWIQLTEQYWNGSYYETLQCSASLPHMGYHQEVTEECEYTPRATIRTHYLEDYYDSNTGITYYQAGVIVAAFEHSDRDGYITNVEKWVDGESITANHVDIYEPTHVRLRVTDNDGHVTETSSTISPPLRQVCMRGGNLIMCDSPW